MDIHRDSIGGKVRADVSKRGVDDGNQKMGTLSSPQKRAVSIISKRIVESMVLSHKIKITSGNYFVLSDDDDGLSFSGRQVMIGAPFANLI
jgi:hypothetical protein